MIAGLDIGTSNCKLSIYEGKDLVVQVGASYSAKRKDGRHTLDALAVWNAVKTLFHKAISANPSAADIKFLAISALGEAAVPLDAHGAPLAEAPLFWDASGRQEVEEIVSRVGKKTIEEISGVVPDAMFTLCKMAWQKKNSPYFPNVRFFMLFEDFIIHRLTGQRAISYSLAGRTMGFDIRAKTWSGQLFEAAGIDPALMSTPLPSGTPVGTVLPAIRSELGLQADTVVTTGGHDQMCVAVGAGGILPGVGSNGSGTVEVMAVTIPTDTPRADLLSNNYTVSIHADPAEMYTYSCNSTGSLLLNWYITTFGDATSATPFQDFEAQAPQKPTNLLSLPYIAGSGTPFMDLGATGGIFGINYGTDKYTIYRSLMEGLTYDLAFNLKTLSRAGVPVHELRCTGGGALSRMWLQIKADVTGIPVHTLETHQAGSLGCMIIASVAAGRYATITDAVKDLVTIKETYIPDTNNHTFYQEQLDKYVKLFGQTRDIVRQS
ncbi:MAG: hypothetical protein LUC93_16805 [Planctomycetaceae bacterium]|nr:hypothetical protein [Planctomycetaceae bacterium]